MKRAIILVLALLLLSCNTPDSIAKFCAAGVAALKTGDAIFDDMKGSCLREVQSREPLATFTVLPSPSSTACDDIGKQADGLKAASQIVAKYFSALNDLASFGTSKAGDGAKDLLTKATTLGKLPAAPQTALASVAGFLVNLATAGYQQKHLADDIVKTNGDLKIVLAGLAESVNGPYKNLLADEQQKTAVRYKEFALQHQNAADVLLILDSRWQADLAALAARRAAAQSFAAALDTLAKGHDDLATHAHSLKAKELGGLLSPYSAQLDSLISAIQKAL
jgi:hypothetical protein